MLSAGAPPPDDPLADAPPAPEGGVGEGEGESLLSLGLLSTLEGAAVKEGYSCANCGHQHSR